MSKVNVIEEAKNIAKKYQEKPEALSKIELLRKLDESVTKTPSIVALSMGIIGTLIFGIGMCCWLVWGDLLALGIVLGIVGAVICIVTPLLYKRMVAVKKEQLSPRIIQLSKEIVNEGN